MTRCVLGLALVWSLFLLSGCRRSQVPLVQGQPPTVTISQPIQREVRDYEEFTGRTDAVYSVDVRARVTGYIIKVPFKEGDIVKEGDVLYEIDPRPYQATLDKAKGDVVRLEGQKKLIDIQVDRYTKLVAKGAGSQQDLDTYLGQQAENAGSLQAARAAVEFAALNLGFCTVTSPITGKVSRTYWNVGNLVNQDSTLLTTVVSTDPMYGYFDVDERTMLRIQQMAREGKIKQPRPGEIPVYIGLATEEGYPHEGIIDFVNNRVDPLTGTITVRGVFKNADRYLTPGLFLRVRVPIGPPYRALLVTERALGTDQGQKYLLVVDDKNEVHYRAVKVGPLRDGLRVIEEGITADDWVIVNGLQRVRAGVTVKADRSTMPLTPAPAPEAKPAVAKPAGTQPPQASPAKP